MKRRAFLTGMAAAPLAAVLPATAPAFPKRLATPDEVRTFETKAGVRYRVTVVGTRTEWRLYHCANNTAEARA